MVIAIIPLRQFIPSQLIPTIYTFSTYPSTYTQGIQVVSIQVF